MHIGKYVPLNIKEFDSNEKYLIFSGIGNHQTFVNMIRNYGLNIIKDIEFPDHYKYTKNDIGIIINQAKNMSAKIITTEKDFNRLKNKVKEIKIIKSELQIVDEKKFINTILNINEAN